MVIRSTASASNEPSRTLLVTHCQPMPRPQRGGQPCCADDVKYPSISVDVSLEESEDHLALCQYVQPIQVGADDDPATSFLSERSDLKREIRLWKTKTTLKNRIMTKALLALGSIILDFHAQLLAPWLGE